MSFLYYVFALIAAGGVFSLLYFREEKNLISKLTGRQLASIVYGVLLFVRLFGGKYQIIGTIGLDVYSPFGPTGDFKALVSLVVIWLIYPKKPEKCWMLQDFQMQ